MKTPYRPQFKKFISRWKKVINKLKLWGIDRVERFILDSEAPGLAEKESLEDNNKHEWREISSSSMQIKTLEDLIKACEIDLNKYEIISHTVKKWSVTAKIENRLVTRQMYGVTARMKEREFNPVETIRGAIDRIKEELGDLETISPPAIIKRSASFLVEPNISDLHIGKVAFNNSGETIWDPGKASEFYSDIISDVLSRVKPHKIKRFLLPVGNDLLNIDSSHNTTFKGTPQMTGKVFEKLIADTELLLIKNILKLSKVAPVDIVCIPGNHDQNSVYHIGRTVWSYFRKNKNIKVYNSHKYRKYYNWERILIGFTHGNNEKISELPAIAALEVPELWAKSITREFHLGHFHRVSSKRAEYISNEQRLKGMTIRICGTVCPSDLWHDLKGYVGSLKRSQTFIYSPDYIEDIIYTNF